MRAGLDAELEAALSSGPGLTGAPSLEEVESLLTRGYAEALELEVERLRVANRIEILLADPEAPQLPRDVAELGTQLASLANSMRSLRGRLAEVARLYRVAQPFTARPG